MTPPALGVCTALARDQGVSALLHVQAALETNDPAVALRHLELARGGFTQAASAAADAIGPHYTE